MSKHTSLITHYPLRITPYALPATAGRRVAHSAPSPRRARAGAGRARRGTESMPNAFAPRPVVRYGHRRNVHE